MIAKKQSETNRILLLRKDKGISKWVSRTKLTLVVKRTVVQVRYFISEIMAKKSETS